MLYAVSNSADNSCSEESDSSPNEASTRSYLSSILKWAILWNANLSGAYLTGADLIGGNLTGAYLTDTDLTKANLEGAENFNTADTTGTRFCRTIMPDGSTNNSGC
jgi:uncharacterized protein YjbI with pentapeptide repeats